MAWLRKSRKEGRTIPEQMRPPGTTIDLGLHFIYTEHYLDNWSTVDKVSGERLYKNFYSSCNFFTSLKLFQIKSENKNCMCSFFYHDSYG